MNIGIIGLGSMGLNLAKNIISKKYKVYAYEENSVIKTYTDVKNCEESEKMGSKKLWEQQVREKLKKSAKMTDF